MCVSLALCPLGSGSVAYPPVPACLCVFHGDGPLWVQPFSAYPVYVLQLGQPAGHLVTQICRAFLVMPEVPPANHSCFQSEDWPRRLVAANPLHWGLWLRDVGDQWRVIIRIAMVLREAARLDRPPLEEYAGEAFTRQGEDLPPMEVRAH